MNPLHRVLGLFKFLREVKTEGKRVNWPTREKTIRDTIVVILIAVVVAAFLRTFAYIFQQLLDAFVI